MTTDAWIALGILTITLLLFVTEWLLADAVALELAAAQKLAIQPYAFLMAVAIATSMTFASPVASPADTLTPRGSDRIGSAPTAAMATIGGGDPVSRNSACGSCAIRRR